MRVVFIGAVAFSHAALKKVRETPIEVVGVCTLESSATNADHRDLRPQCEEAGIASLYTPDINAEESLQWIRERRPDVIFCFGWSRLLKRPLLDIAPLGVVGFHPAALPANRGRHPLVWALALDLRQTATTFFFMDESADGGDILSQRLIGIDDCDDAGSLYRKMTLSALEQIEEFVPRLATGRYLRLKQDPRAANTWRKRGRADGQIDWRMSARSVYNLVRALTRPYVGAHFVRRGRDIKVWRSEIVAGTSPNLEPGKVLEIDERGIIVACGEQAIRLLDVDAGEPLVVGEYL